MAEIHLANLAHSYNPSAQVPDYALEPLDMTWSDGQTYALLGPSGCGKSTMLSIISGLLRPSEGRVMFDGQDVTAKDTRARNIAQVFQVPVIYRSMTVAQNIAFPLVCRRVPAHEIRKRVDHLAELLEMTHLLRTPAVRLTADQKQLVSLARGLVRDDVSALLLDEPLTVIDPHVKFALRRKLKAINSEYRMTMVLVTHDQNEALSFAQNIIVMNHGKIIQAGTPQDLFEKPDSEYVGYFIGSPAMNFLKAKVGDGQIILDGSDAPLHVPHDLRATDNLKLGFRPEHVDPSQGDIALTGRVRKILFEGVDRVLEIEAGQNLFRARLESWPGAVGDHVALRVRAANMHWYVNGLRIGQAVSRFRPRPNEADQKSSS